MDDAVPRFRWFSLTPDRLIFALLAAEGFLWLSERFHWFAFNAHKGWTVLIAVASIGVFFLVMFLWFVGALVFHWRFQYSIRSLLILTVVAALPCSWLAVERKKAEEQQEAVGALKKFPGIISYDSPNSKPQSLPRCLEPLRKLLGDDFFEDVRFVCLAEESFTDADMAHITSLPELEDLRLNSDSITDAGLRHLKELHQLQRLLLAGNQITDAGLEYLKELHQLQELHLSDTQITDAGLEYLTGLTRLQRLEVPGAQVTDVGVKKLRQALPNCKIDF